MQRVKTTQDLELKERLVAVNRVTKVTKGGRTFTFAAIVVVGNEDGIVGYGLGKAGEVAAAMQKATEAAKKNLIQVPVLKGTIPHEQFAKFGGSANEPGLALPRLSCGGRPCHPGPPGKRRGPRHFPHSASVITPDALFPRKKEVPEAFASGTSFFRIPQAFAQLSSHPKPPLPHE